MKLNKLAKLLISFAITATPLIFTSCSSGDDNNEENIDSPNLDKTEIRHNVSIENQLKILLRNNTNELVEDELLQT